ncbi:hypothetical protein L207DRAFT_458175 [Hyaloscypha variabilis F]|uniref:ABM domain-containing protein n=1 Tax=Hyaloscypha variabilis (strain UAMH 11265 / GT02V1 / F) TaxID=1149755 RepID=A0A2J6RSZ2_HYAVF|nr:hypothetical protein L207DRAFT_458175 [Hyaloscypha variabilis F]
MAEPTQILTISLPPSTPIEDRTTSPGKTWQQILELIRLSPGYQRLYWGRHIEDPDKVQLHIVRTLHQNHTTFLTSPSYNTLTTLLSTLTPTQPTIRHALISAFSPSCKSLGKGAPVTGTAIYLCCTENWDIAWARWVAFVQGVPGFLGIAGGPVLEEVDGNERAFIALVGWESVEVHEAYHRTRHFKEEGRRVLLDEAGGYAYYGHIAFAHSEEKGEGPKL